MFTIWELLAMIKACLISFLNGVKDGIFGILSIYSLDKQIEQLNAERIKHFQNSNAARARSNPHRRSTDSTKDDGFMKHRKPRVLKTLLFCIGLSVFALLSLGLFSGLLMPLLHHFSYMLLSIRYENPAEFEDSLQLVSSIFGFFFSVAWVIPLYILCKVVNGIWFSDVAENVYTLYYGKPKLFVSFSAATADFLYAIFLETVFLLQAYIMKYLFAQTLGWCVYGFHQALLYSLYAFEYKWFYMGIHLRKRLEIIERHWPYFLGFGLPYFFAIQFVYMHYSVIASANIFAIAFPFMIIHAMRASAPSLDIGHRLPLFQPSVLLCSCFCSSALRRNQQTRANR